MPAWVATPPNASSTVRFFDSSPFSPSGLFLALTRFAPGAEGAPMRFGDAPSAVVLVELATGAETRVATTRGADSQLGAQVQWGRTDAELYFNDVVVDAGGARGGARDGARGGRARAIGVRLELAFDAAGGAPPRVARRDELACTVYGSGRGAAVDAPLSDPPNLERRRLLARSLPLSADTRSRRAARASR